MRKLVAIFLFTCACYKLQAQVNIITSICGNDTAAYTGDGNLAKNAKLNVPCGIYADKLNNIYIADAFNHAIRKINFSTNIITTIAGTGEPDLSGDNGPATNAKLYIPEGICLDNADNIYIADAGNNRIRKVIASTGVIITIAGSGPVGVNSAGDSGDGGQATNALIGSPSGICIDKVGNIYIADYSNNKVRKVEASTGIITTIAGKSVIGYTGGFVAYTGDGGPATDAQFSGPAQVFVDQFNNIFISDQYNYVIRKIDAITNVITTIAGKGTKGYSGDNGPATNAQLNEPSGLFVDDKENIFIAEYRNGTVRKVNGTTGIITTVAGNGISGFAGDGGPANNAEMKCTDVWVDKYGTIYIADMDNNRIRMVRDTTLHVGIATVQKSEVKVYPNPASNELIIEGAEGSEVSVYDMVGEKMYSEQRIVNSEKIDISKLANAMYIIQIISPTGNKEVRRFVKE